MQTFGASSFGLSYARLPNTLREYMLQNSLGQASLVLDLVYSLGIRAGERVTVARVMLRARDGGIGISDKLVRRGLSEARVFGRVEGEWKRRGRPESVWLVPEIRALCREFHLKWGFSDVLRPGDFASLKAYRMGLHRAYVQRCPGVYSRKFLGDRLGVSERATYNYEQEMTSSVVVEFRFGESEVTWETVEQLQETSYREQGLHGGPRFLCVVDMGRRKVEVFPMKRFFAQRGLAQGRRVFIRWQEANYYRGA